MIIKYSCSLYEGSGKITGKIKRGEQQNQVERLTDYDEDDDDDDDYNDEDEDKVV